MAVDTPKRLAGPVAMGTSATTFYTAPGSTTAIVRHLRVVNTTNGPITFKMSIGADAAGTRIYSDFSVPANDVYIWNGFEVLAAGETLRGVAAGAGLTLTVSGIESV